MKRKSREISKDGIAGSRMAGIFVNAILLPWGLGVFKKMCCNILLGVIAVILIWKGKKEVGNFFEKNDWEKEYWYVYLGLLFCMSDIYSVLSYYDISPCGVCSIYIRAGIMSLIFVISRMTIPPNTKFALFVTKNYEIKYGN